MKQPTANRRSQMKAAAFRARVKSVALCAAAVLIVLSCAAAKVLALAYETIPLPRVAVQAPPIDIVEVVPIHRFAFPYSVISRGVYSATELRHALAIDTVAAEHHQAVDLDAVRTEIVTAPRLVYMSYRIGDDVAWTKHPVLLPAGETILTDGVSEIRARCGNGMSEAPMEPTADREPHPVEFDALGDLASYAPGGTGVPLLNGSALTATPSGGPVLSGGQSPVGDGMFSGAPGSLGGMTPWPQHSAYGGPGPFGSSPPAASALEQIAGDKGLVDFTGSPLPPDVLDHPNPGGDDPGNGGSDPGDTDSSDPKDPNDPDDDPDDPTDPEDPDDPTDPEDPDDPGDDPDDPGGDPDDPDDVPTIPEPGTMLLFGTGAAAELLRRLRARRRDRHRLDPGL